MKLRINCWGIPALALALVACKKSEEAKAPEAPVAVEAPVMAPPAAPAPVLRVPGLSPEERAAKLGFVQHLPQEIEVAMAFHHGSKHAKRVKASKLWKLIQGEMGGAPEAVVDEVTAEPVGPAALFSKEFTIALGKSIGEQTGNLLTLYRRMGYFQMRALATALAESAKSGDFSALEEAFTNQYGMELMKNLMADPESGVALFERMKMPPLYLAFGTSPDGREAAAQQLAAFTENLGMLGEMVEPAVVEKVGQTFTGHRVSGAKISEQMAADRSGMEAMLEPEMVDRLLAAIAKKDLVVLSGTIGNYAMLFIGSSVEDLKLAPGIGESMVANDSLAFCDEHVSKDLAAVVYGQKEALKLMTDAAGGLSDMAGGLRDGLAGSEGLGDTRDLEALLRMVAERETALRQLVSTESTGMAVFFEDGLKIEAYGGTDAGAIDWKAANRLASLGDAENVVMFANMTGGAAYDEKMRAYFEALMETAYAMAMKVSELPMEDGDMTKFKKMAGIFDTKFRPDAVALWDALRGDFSAGIGGENALVVDLNGTVPAIPGLPQAVVDEAKFPRVSLVAPVTDRAKLASAWQSMNSSATGILAKISEMNGQEIPMQKPISSEKNGFTTWFFPLPFFNDDFVPSVTVGDQWFAASTSKNQALDLLAKAGQGGEGRSGLWFTMNFKALRVFVDGTLDVLAKHPDALPLDRADLDKIRKLSAAMEEMDKLTLHSRRESGLLRTSIHFKTR
ncbi:MAG: hypothetical protein Q8Q59_01625 [Luteolibacter sp.]|jgi:hypothetical protein|nr:hypothetical protein [Luteolibacter sp.]